MSEPDDIVGHKTLDDGHGGLRHEPLTRSEADAIMASVDAAKAKRAALYPTSEDAVKGLWDAWYRLKELGWLDPCYSPADSRVKKVIELGSTGLHDAHCDPRESSSDPRTKWWWTVDHGICPIDPIFYMPDEQEKADREARMLAARARWQSSEKSVEDAEGNRG